MTSDNLPALFEGKEIRAIEQDGQILFPLADLAEAWGVHRNTLPELIDRHPERFAGFHTTTAHVTCAGLRAVNEPGLYLLMGAVSTKRLKNEQAAAAILRFQRWVPALVQAYRKGEIQQPARLLSDDVREALKVARIISEETGVSLPIAQCFALEKVGAAEWQKLLPAATMPTGHLTATDIGNRIGYTAHQVNLWLYNNKLLVKDSENKNEWRLTEAGKMHAEEFPFTRNGHSGYQIKWRDSIFALMNMSGSQRQICDPATV